MIMRARRLLVRFRPHKEGAREETNTLSREIPRCEYDQSLCMHYFLCHVQPQKDACVCCEVREVTRVVVVSVLAKTTPGDLVVVVTIVEDV